LKNYNDAMKSIISIVLNTGKNGYDEAVRFGIESKHFARDKYKVIWDAIEWLDGDGSNINLTTVRKCMDVNKTLKYLSDSGHYDQELKQIRSFASKENIDALYTYIRMLIDEYSLNETYKMAELLLSSKTSGQQQKIMEEYQDKIHDGDVDQPLTITEALDKMIDNAEKSQNSVVDVMKTKLPLLNKYLILTPQNQTVIAGDTGQGKSSLALQLVEDIASQTLPMVDPDTNRKILDDDFNEVLRQRVVLFFALEMSTEEITMKIYCSRNNLSYDDMINLPKKDFLQLAKIAREYTSVFLPNLVIVDEFDMNLNGIRKHCSRTKLKYGYLDVVVVDHIGLLEEIYMDSANETRQYKHASRFMKMKIAKKLGTHTILVSQLNKAFISKDGRANHQPTADRLFGSSGIKQDATNIIMVYWEKKIGLAETKTLKRQGANVAEIKISTSYTSKLIIEKSRYGSTVTPKIVGFIPYIQRFIPLELIDKWNLLYAKDDKNFRLTDEQLAEALQY
jgi:replicative DNA helicase